MYAIHALLGCQAKCVMVPSVGLNRLPLDKCDKPAQMCPSMSFKNFATMRFSKGGMFIFSLSAHHLVIYRLHGNSKNLLCAYELIGEHQ
ncbi:hypothetical protein NC653_038393 [Populus alba x Populus x berolinensis]|uniref:Uncharacterized protein n=1 Tax=Populus alba x Populus x berolinensis TaxID=444605 RepID=A0AAD6LGQ3_9ROSI|nr:hypothetical protein NC653_038393 [Populus alba x Populus x berolinensis]